MHTPQSAPHRTAAEGSGTGPGNDHCRLHGQHRRSRHSGAVNYPQLVTRRGCIGIFQALNASLGNLIYNHSQSRSRIQCKTHVFLSPGCDSECTVSACTTDMDMNMNMNAIAITYSTVSNACTIFIFNLHSLLITCAN